MSKLFQPITIGSMTIKNRFVRSATQDYIGNPDGSISEAELALYEQLASNEVGLIITAHSYVQHPLGYASVRQNAIYSDAFIPGYQRLVDTVHKHGAKLVLQISHAGRQMAPDRKDLTPIAPSAVPDTSIGVTPRAMTQDEIHGLIEDFVEAMLRVKKTGCDGVQLHIAHGYCLSNFISPYTNRRTDEWGGSVENRTRIIREIMVRGRQAVGPEYPIWVKLNSTDGKTGPEYLALEDVLYTAKMLEAAGVTAIEISGGIREFKNTMSAVGIKQPEQEAYFASAAKAVKAAVQVPVILVGGLRSLAVMQSVLSDGVADMVAMSRPFVKEPDLVVKLKNGQDKVQCFSCNACFNPQGLACYAKK